MNHLAKCPDCGKIFAARTGKELCAQCMARRDELIDRVIEAVETYEKQTPEEIAKFAGVTLHEVTRIINDSSLLSRAVDARPMCERCKEQPAQPRAKYCLSCRLLLNRDLGGAVQGLSTRLADEKLRVAESAKSRPTGLANAIEQKRNMAGTDRLNPTPRNKYRSSP